MPVTDDEYSGGVSETLLGMLRVPELFPVLQANSSMMHEACDILEKFLVRFEIHHHNDKGKPGPALVSGHQASRKRALGGDLENGQNDLDDTRLVDLCCRASEASKVFCRLATGTSDGNNSGNGSAPKSGNRNRKRTWQQLQEAAQMLQNYADGTATTSPSYTPSTSSTPNRSMPLLSSNGLALSLVFGALALVHDDTSASQNCGGAKAAASALSSTISRNKPLWHAGQPLARQVLRRYLMQAGIQMEDESSCIHLNLQILNHFVKAFKLGGGVEPHISATAITNAIRIGRENETQDSDASLLIDNCDEEVKRRVSGALALACQLQPWSKISPLSLVEIAIQFSLWHAAEEVCHSAHKAASSSLANKNGTKIDLAVEGLSSEQQKENAETAVRSLIDAAMEDRLYRCADSFATNLFDAGGSSMYVEARYYHACETISKVILRRQIPIVDRQIDRVDKAVAKVSNSSNAPVTMIRNVTSLVDEDDASSTPFSPSFEIRKFALRKLEEVGDITAAKRLASLHGMDFVYDERAAMLATAMRKRQYLQYEDVLEGGVPSLIETAEDLRSAFQRLREGPCHCGPFGLDAEWDEETVGVAVLQLSSIERVILIDLLELSVTEEGVDALEETVGKLLGGCSDAVVAAFACRQDLSRLRASPCHIRPAPKESHWLSRGTSAVVDVQTMVGNADRSLYKAGLSRVTQALLGKPLDKSEQCSMWSERPLSESQRSYAALDAWTCVAILNKVQMPKTANTIESTS